MFIIFTNYTHRGRYERTWNGIYHTIKSETKKEFKTVCGLKKTIKKFFNVYFLDDPPDLGWLCCNCERIDRINEGVNNDIQKMV